MSETPQLDASPEPKRVRLCYSCHFYLFTINVVRVPLVNTRGLTTGLTECMTLSDNKAYMNDVDYQTVETGIKNEISLMVLPMGSL